MRAMTNKLAMAGVAGVLIMGAVAPAAAQTWNDPYYGGPHRTYRHGGLIEAQVAGHFGAVPYTRGFAWPGRSCVTDEGYGRFLPCDKGGGL